LSALTCGGSGTISGTALGIELPLVGIIGGAVTGRDHTGRCWPCCIYGECTLNGGCTSWGDVVVLPFVCTLSVIRRFGEGWSSEPFSESLSHKSVFPEERHESWMAAGDGVQVFPGISLLLKIPEPCEMSDLETYP